MPILKGESSPNLIPIKTSRIAAKRKKASSNLIVGLLLFILCSSYNH